MKLLIINTSRCNPVVGGIEACSNTLARGLISRGHKVCFLYTRRIPLTADFDVPAPEYAMPSDADYDYDASCVEFYCKLLRELEIDTVLFQRAVLENRYFFLENIPADLKIRKVAAVHCSPLHRVFPFREQYLMPYHSIKEFVYSVGGFIFPGMMRRYMAPKLKAEYQRCNMLADTVVMLSPSYVKIVGDFAGIDTAHFVAIPNSYGNTMRGLPLAKERLVVFIGRFTAFEKNPLFFVKMWRLLAARFPNWKALMIGEGNAMGKVKRYISRHNIPNITIEPPTSCLDDIYDRASVLVNTSFSESFGNVLVEAMAHGCVPVASKYCGAVPDIFGNDAGVVVQSLMPVDYADAVAALISSPEQLRSKAQAAFERSERFSPELYIDRWEKVLMG